MKIKIGSQVRPNFLFSLNGKTSWIQEQIRDLFYNNTVIAFLALTNKEAIINK